MKTNTKRVIYSTYCRPSMLYGCEFIDISEPILRQIRTDECILMKKILSVEKRSKNSLIYNTFKILDPTYEIYLRKLSLIQRLTENRYTRQLLKNLEILNKEEKIKNTIINDVESFVNIFDEKTNNKNACATIKSKLIIMERESVNNGLIDSINYCIDNRNKESRLHKLLNLFLTQNWKRKDLVNEE